MTQNETSQALDHHLRNAVLETLETDPQTRRLDLRVGTLNAIVHLAGEAPNLEIRERAERLAATVPGVRGVVNRIEAPGAPSPSRVINLDLYPRSDEGDEYEGQL